MGNNVRTQNDATWVDGYTPTPADWEDLERKIFGSWNGVRGGAYVAPYAGGSSAYTFGGSGIKIGGPTRLTKGGAIYGGAGKWVIGDGAWPTLGARHSARERTIVQPIHSFVSKTPWLWSRNHAYAGIGSIALACRTTFGREIEVPELFVPLRVHNGATLTKVEITFRVATRRKYAPLAMPKFRVLRVPKDSLTDALAPLKATADGLGFDAPAIVTSPVAWYAEAAAQNFTYVCDQNNVIDVENYSYVAHIVEELGAQSPEEEFDGLRLIERKPDVFGVTLNTNTASFATGSLMSDGLNVPGARTIIVDPDRTAQADVSARNGIWLPSGGGWVRARDADESLDWSPGWIVRVLGGATNGGSTWQCSYPSSQSRMNLTATTSQTGADFTWPKIVPAEPKGNIYHSLSPTFEIADLRFQ